MLVNGSNSSTKLTRIQNRLEKAGYTITKTNETSQTETTTMIVRGNVEDAVKEELKLLTEATTVSNAESDEVSITVIIGTK